MAGDRSIEETRSRLNAIWDALDRIMKEADEIEEHLISAVICDGRHHTEQRLLALGS